MLFLYPEITTNSFGVKISNHFTYAIASDGDLMEGISHEAASLAGHLKLNKLIVFFDDNGISIDGPVSLSNSENTTARFKSYNWNTISINGHSPKEITKAIKTAQKSKKPTLISCKTKIGYGSPNKQGKSSSHGSPLGEDEIKLTRRKLNWDHKPFIIPKKILDEWRTSGQRSTGEYKKWHSNLNKLVLNKKNEFLRRLNGKLPKELNRIFSDFKKECIKNPSAIATRQSSYLSFLL